MKPFISTIHPARRRQHNPPVARRPPVKRLMNCYAFVESRLIQYRANFLRHALHLCTQRDFRATSTSDIENSKLVVMFGNNPAETRHERRRITGFEQARERLKCARMIVIDPPYRYRCRT